MDLSLKNRARSSTSSTGSPPLAKKEKPSEQDDSSLSSDSPLLNNQDTIDEEQQLWQDESWVNEWQEIDDSGVLTSEVITDTYPLSSTPNNEMPSTIPPSALNKDNPFSLNSSKRTAILNYTERIVLHMEEVGKKALEKEMIDLWAYSIGNRLILDALCDSFKVKKANFINLDGIVALYQKLKAKSIEDQLEENKNISLKRGSKLSNSKKSSWTSTPSPHCLKITKQMKPKRLSLLHPLKSPIMCPTVPIQ